jgi:hypothetical protein
MELSATSYFERRPLKRSFGKWHMAISLLFFLGCLGMAAWRENIGYVVLGFVAIPLLRLHLCRFTRCPKCSRRMLWRSRNASRINTGKEERGLMGGRFNWDGRKGTLYQWNCSSCEISWDWFEEDHGDKSRSGPLFWSTTESI